MMLGEGLLEEDDTRRLAYIRVAAEIEMVGHDSVMITQAQHYTAPLLWKPLEFLRSCNAVQAMIIQNVQL